MANVWNIELTNERTTQKLFSKLTCSNKDRPLLSEIKTGQREVKFKLVGMSKFLNCL